jgi:hypothetical protein
MQKPLLFNFLSLFHIGKISNAKSKINERIGEKVLFLIRRRCEEERERGFRMPSVVLIN